MPQQYLPVETLDRWLQRRMLDVHTAMPCEVLAYDASAQTVDVRPQIAHIVVDSDNERIPEHLPDLFDVPVAFPRGGGFHVSFPLAAGDYVLVVCAEEPIGTWRDKARRVSPGILSRHGLDGAFALPMGYPDTEKLSSPSGTDLVIASDDGQSAVVVQPGGSVLVGDDSATQGLSRADRVDTELQRVKAELDAVKTDLTTLKTAIAGAAVIAMDGGAALKTNILAALTTWPAMAPGTPSDTSADKVKGT